MYVDEYWRQFSQVHFKWYHAFTVMYAFIFAFGVAANLMVLQYIITKKPKRPGLYFLMNLAVSDLLKIAINIPMNVVSNFYGEWIFGQIGCDIYVICGGVFGFVNISTLVFMSIERFLMIKTPLLALKLSKTTVFACIAISWIYSLACILPQKFLEHGFVLEGFLTSCTFNYLDRSLISRLNIMIMFIAGFFIPMTIIMIVYTLMWYNLRNNTAYSGINVRLALRQEQEVELLSMTSSQLAMVKFQRNSSTPTSEDYLKREVRVARTIILINLAFIVAWMPYALVALFAQYAPVTSLPLFVTPFSTSLPSLFSKLSSIYNPILYTLTNDGCRAHFKYIFFKRLFRGKQTDF